MSDIIDSIFNIVIPESEIPEFLKIKSVVEDKRTIFNNFLGIMRDFQIEAFNASKLSDIGQINMPTGTGKTLIQKAIHIEDMINKDDVGETGVYVIASHRLGLCNQLFQECMNLIFDCGIACDMLYIGSEKYDFTKIVDSYSKKGIKISTNCLDAKATTVGDSILKAVKNAKENKRHIFIVSTYHSFGRLNALSGLGIEKPISICTFDEAHTTTKEDFQENINIVKPLISRQYYFTATRRVRGEMGGQNNFEFYGNILFEMSIRDAIERGEIVRPVLHRILCKDDSGMSIKTNEWMMVKTIMDCFNEHRKQVKNVSNNKDTIGSKLLITVDGLKFIREICNNEDFINFCKDNNINVYSFSSRDGEKVNFEKVVNRQTCVCSMNNMKQEEDAILFHYDILTEGIDLPAITGVLIMRNLETIKLLQNIGRAARLLKSDRNVLYTSGKTDSVEVKDLVKSNFVKPYSWVIIPDYLKSLNRDDAIRMKEMLEEIVTTYDMVVENMVVSDMALADVDAKLNKVTVNPDNKTPDKDYTLEHIIKMLEFNQLTDEQKMAYLDVE